MEPAPIMESPSPSPSSSPSQPSTTGASLPSTRTWMTLLVTFFQAWFAGLWDALAFNRVLVIATMSPKIYKPILNCLFLNGVIFVGSYIVFHHIIAPLLQYEAVSWIFFVVYYIIWLFPIYCFSFIVNAAWYSDIAEQAFILSGRTQYKGSVNFVRTFTDSVYNNILCLSFIIISVLASLLPRPIGPLIYFIMLCWLYAFYCFETKWTLRGKWGLRKRIYYFEEHWVYMLGFGTPFTLAFFFFPFLVSAGVYAFLFPFFLILAVQAKRQKKIESPFWFIPQRFPIFVLADWVTRTFLGLFSQFYR
eukprot:Phypoly_transcript_11011.p1 GENE.Phypoly_transcript_11011~~Phypoly_transcript_11011.p1  ORF type:complete len:305 (+),score=20.27 Phypoly_transcript_11011:21-935(+)